MQLESVVTMKTFTIVHDKEPKFEGGQFATGRVAILRAELNQVESWDSEHDMLVALGEGHEIVWDEEKL